MLNTQEANNDKQVQVTTLNQDLTSCMQQGRQNGKNLQNDRELTVLRTHPPLRGPLQGGDCLVPADGTNSAGEGGEDFAEVYAMIVLGFIIAVNPTVNEAVWIHILIVDLATLKYEGGLVV